jgi:hypothetical protein
MTKKAVVAEGSLWEGPSFEIHTDYILSNYEEHCRHCRGPFTRELLTNKLVPEYYICPVVIVAHNEGGYNSTGLCGLCVKEALGL